MDRFIRDMSDPIRIALILVLVAGALALTIAWSDDIGTKISLSLICAGMVVGAIRLATPGEVRIVWLRHASLFAAAGVASSVMFFKDWVDCWLLAFVQHVDPSFELNSSSKWISALVLLFMLSVVWIVNRGNIVRTATVRTRRGILDHPDNRADRDQLIDDLSAYIDRLDEELRWNRKHFIELETDIDLVLSNERRRSTGNLLQAIRSNSTARLFVVLGDPGSGKSVALRTLMRSLLRQALNNGQIPIYINLCEWQGNAPVLTEFETGETSPIAQFILRFLRAQLSDVSYGFLRRHFDRLQSEGQFFFILDSFDEIPAVLDSNESSALIRELSEQLYRFVLSGHGARGLIASRYFRRPTIRRRDRCVLEIRPFNDTRIEQIIDQQALNPEVLKRRIFIESVLLGSAARSPFLLSLILDYEKYQAKPVPDNQVELFQTYISQAIADAVSVLDRSIEPLPDLMLLCKHIARLMFERSDLGLDVPLSTLAETLDFPHLDESLATLRDHKLFRISENRHLSFTHRRFQEYFIVQTYFENPHAVPIEEIVEDSRWRDSMVLYAEIVPDQQVSRDAKLGVGEAGSTEGEAERIAEFCWQHIRVLSINSLLSEPEQYLRGLNAMRFLVEAFRSRPQVVNSFRKPFAEQVMTLLQGDSVVDLLNARYAVESVTFMSDQDAAKVLEVALNIESPWISETAFRACRYLGKVPETVIEALRLFVQRLTFREIRQHRRELSVALSFHDQFSQVRRELGRSNLQTQLCSLVFWALLFLTPLVCLLLMFFSLGNIIVTLALAPAVNKNELLRRLSRSDVIDLFSYGFTPIMSPWIIVLWIPIVIVLIASSFFVSKFVTKLSEWWPQAQSLLSMFSLYIPLVASGLVLAVLIIGPRDIILIGAWKKLVGSSMGEMFSKNREYLSSLILVIIGLVVVEYFDLGTIIISFEWLVDLIYIFIFIIFPIVVVGKSVYELYRLIRNRVTDYRLLRESTRVFSPDRNTIALHFLGFKTDAYRAHYVRWLEDQVPNQRALDQLAESDNVWPQGVRPNVANDDASARLAQLDARWIGIERH